VKRGGRLVRRTPLQAHAPLRRKTALAGRRADSALPPALTVKPRATRSRFLPAAAALIRARSGGMCEIGLLGCWGRASEKSHRITQKSGGRHGVAKERSDRPSNALDACHWCHLVITERPWLVDAKGNGLVLVEHQEPTQEPVLYRGALSYLDDAGGLRAIEAVGA
jgi:hypothetical protein